MPAKKVAEGPLEKGGKRHATVCRSFFDTLLHEDRYEDTKTCRHDIDSRSQDAMWQHSLGTDLNEHKVH